MNIRVGVICADIIDFCPTTLTHLPGPKIGQDQLKQRCVLMTVLAKIKVKNNN